MLASLTTAMAALALTAASPQAPHWEADYGKALEQTRADDRPLLIVLENTADEKQQLNVDSDKELLAAYDLCRVDVSTEYGKKVAEAFKAEKFPFTAIIDKSGVVILHKQTGAVTSSSWKATLTKYQKGERAVRYTVAKPVVNEASISIEASSSSTPVYYSPQPSYYNPPSDCPNCRRGY